MPRFPPSRLVRRLPARRHHVLARLRLRAGIRQPLTNSVVEDYDGMIQEGHAHNGMSALIDLVARKS
jgi:hypothetical protein